MQQRLKCSTASDELAVLRAIQLRRRYGSRIPHNSDFVNPATIVTLTRLVRTVADEGRTVLFSSHLLDEVKRVADEVAMLHEGKIVLHGSLDMVKETHHRLTLRFPEPQTAAPSMPGMPSCEGGELEWTVICNGEKSALKAAAEALGAKVVDESVPSFEEIFVARVREHYAAGKGN